MNIIETLFGPHLRGPMSTKLNVGHAGFGTVGSGIVATSIAAVSARSGSIIMITEQLTGSAGVAVNSGGPLVVSAINDGVSFSVSNGTGVAVPWNRNFSWFIVRTN